LQFSRIARPLVAAFIVAMAAAPSRAQQAATALSPRPGATLPIPNATPEHLAAARELVAASGLASSFLEVIPNLMGQVNLTVTNTRPELIPDMKATLEALAPEFGKYPEDMLNVAARIYTAVMTEQECKDALAFFHSPIGKKFIDVQPTVIGNLNPLIQNWAQQVSAKMMDRVREEMKKKGHQI
jgi:hypothetical protein